MKRPIICQCCRGWYETPEDCPACKVSFHQVTVQWDYWLWSAVAIIHNLLNSQFRERRGVVTLHGVPPPIGFALIRHFAHPQPHLNRGGAVYTNTHPSWKQGTSANKNYHFMKFSYDEMQHVRWAFPLGDYFPKTSVGSVRLVSKGRFSDMRIWGTPVQFKYRWAGQKTQGEATPGLHVFTISANIGHASLSDGTPRFNTEYRRWTAEMQQEQLVDIKRAIKSFPPRPLRATHKLSKKLHPLHEWAGSATLLPAVAAASSAIDDDEDDDEGLYGDHPDDDPDDDDDDDDDGGSDAPNCS
jgi:hypothetical protein